MTEQQEARLPVYAKDAISLLRMRLREKTEALEAAQRGPLKGSAIVLDPFSDNALRFNPHHSVQFTENVEDRCSGLAMRYKVDYEGRWYVQVNGNRALLIRPEVANSIRVYLDD